MAKIVDYMQYDYLKMLRGSHAAWRLLAADQAPFIAAFFYREFLAEKRRAIEEDRLIEDLEDFIYESKRGGSEEQLLRLPGEYLEIWSDPQHMWLRRFYGENDEVRYDLTAAAQKAVEWLIGLRKQSFVGTESRLRTVFDLLHQIARETDLNVENRLAYLRGEQEKIQKEITAIRESGRVQPVLDELQVKERFLQASATAEGILSDFREVEENFRALEQRLMERIVTWKQGKGELLEKVFADRDLIRNSEQGRSFAAFWRFLMLSQQQEDFTDTLQKVLQADSLRALVKENHLLHIDRAWVEAASEVQLTIAQLSKQIRRYVDERYLLEERHIYEIIQRIECQAIQAKGDIPQGVFAELDAAAPKIDLPMDRPLFVPPQRTRLENHALEAGSSQASVAALFQQVYVDKAQLKRNIQHLLQQKTEVTLAEIVQEYPLQQGLTELLAYLVLAGRGEQHGFFDESWQEILFERDGRKLLTKCETFVFRRKGRE